MIPDKITTWVINGITTLGDIVDENGEIQSMEYIQTKWNVKSDFLLHLRLKKKIQLLTCQQNKAYVCIFPQLSHILHHIEIGNKGNKNIYFNILGKDPYCINIIKEKWSEHLNDEINTKTLQAYFKNAKQYSPSVYQYYNQYKLIHRRTVHNQLLKKMKIVESENCLFCKDQTETIEHIYLQCPNSINLWNETITWVRNIYDRHFIISDQEKIFGTAENIQVTNLLIISVKDVIYQKRKEGKRMSIFDVKRCLLKNFSIIKLKDIIQDDLEHFEVKWEPFIIDLRNDAQTRNSWFII